VEERTEETRDAQAASVGSQPASPEQADFEFNRDFRKWLSATPGISQKLLDSLDRDDDWTFVIKMHGILEAGLNHLILSRLHIPEAIPKLADIVSRLETNDRRTGKMAFIKAYDLLPDDACMFVRVLSEIRNRAVHDIKNFDLDLVSYLQSLNKEQKQNWKVALTSWTVTKPVSHELLDFALKVPRNAIFNSCMMIMIRSYHARPERLMEAARQELLRRHPEIAKLLG
jgi:hypothetical protein